MENGEETAIFVGEETFLDLIYNPSEKYLKDLDRLYFFLRHDIHQDPAHLVFDVYTVGDRPAKFQKQQVYAVLYNMLHHSDVTKEYFYWFVANHTNLGDMAAVKKALRRIA